MPRGIKMEVEVPERIFSEKKILQLKRRAEALTTQRQEMTIPIAWHRKLSKPAQWRKRMVE